MIGIIGMMMTKIKMLRSQFIRKEVKSITSSDAESERFFGMTLWCEEDIENALEVCDVRPTADAVSAVRRFCESHWFTDRMVEMGWDVMYDYINDHRSEWEEGDNDED